MEADATILEALAASAVAQFVAENAWAYPALETAHILGIALVLGGIFILDLRLIGAGRDIAVSALSRLVLPWVMAGIAINIVTGALMFISDAAEFAANASFRVKLIVLALALVNAAMFQAGVGRNIASWDRSVMPPTAARLQGALSIALWVGVVTAGRMMAYLK